MHRTAKRANRGYKIDIKDETLCTHIVYKVTENRILKLLTKQGRRIETETNPG